MVDAEAVPEVRYSKDELDQERVLGASDTVIDITGILAQCQITIPNMKFSEYEDFMDDLKMLGTTAAQFGRDLGLGRNTVYSWKKWGVPQYAKAYLHVKMELSDYQIRYGSK